MLQSLHDGFEEWLSRCEGEVALPVRLEGDPREIRRQLDLMKVCPMTPRRKQGLA